MNQLIQILVSVLFGFLYGVIFKWISKKLFLTSIVTTVLTICYVAIMYFLNHGIINYILKISIIIGFILYLNLSKINKKV